METWTIWRFRLSRWRLALRLHHLFLDRFKLSVMRNRQSNLALSLAANRVRQGRVRLLVILKFNLVGYFSGRIGFFGTLTEGLLRSVELNLCVSVFVRLIHFCSLIPI